MNLPVDVNTLRTIVTLLSLLAFIGIWRWAWSRTNQADFADAAQLPFQADEGPAP